MKYSEIINDKLRCKVCPRNCILSDGAAGFCKVRKNINGEIRLISYGYATGLAIDPIEKKPLYHFYPNSKVLSFGTFGCNMGCLFCQNHHMSKHGQDFSMSVKISPETIVKTAIAYDCKSVAFTYNDPIVFLEYAIDTAKLCKEKKIKTVAVTAGYMNETSRRDFYSHIDAANIDLKGFTAEFYKKNCFAKIEPILDTIKYVSNETDCVLELTTLLIEGENDNPEDLKRQFDWILTELNDEIPLHLSAFHPEYKFLDKKQTSLETLLKAYEMAKSAGLKYVYTGNIPDLNSSATVCPCCKRILVKRNGYHIQNTGIMNGKCTNCGTKIYGSF